SIFTVLGAPNSWKGHMALAQALRNFRAIYCEERIAYNESAIDSIINLCVSLIYSPDLHPVVVIELIHLLADVAWGYLGVIVPDQRMRALELMYERTHRVSFNTEAELLISWVDIFNNRLDDPRGVAEPAVLDAFVIYYLQLLTEDICPGQDPDFIERGIQALLRFIRIRRLPTAPGRAEFRAIEYINNWLEQRMRPLPTRTKLTARMINNLQSGLITGQELVDQLTAGRIRRECPETNASIQYAQQWLLLWARQLQITYFTRNRMLAALETKIMRGCIGPAALIRALDSVCRLPEENSQAPNYIHEWLQQLYDLTAPINPPEDRFAQYMLNDLEGEMLATLALVLSEASERTLPAKLQRHIYRVLLNYLEEPTASMLRTLVTMLDNTTVNSIWFEDQPFLWRQLSGLVDRLLQSDDVYHARFSTILLGALGGGDLIMDSALTSPSHSMVELIIACLEKTNNRYCLPHYLGLLDWLKKRAPGHEARIQGLQAEALKYFEANCQASINRSTTTCTSQRSSQAPQSTTSITLTSTATSSQASRRTLKRASAMHPNAEDK
ncbi:MAG TPA: hypothetical protein PLV25_03440, partial [Opitutales bacterium]|nr:hypothetical protein [Opitutales bacterium]